MTTDAIREDGFYWVRDHDDAAPWIPAELSRTYWFLPGAGAGMAQSDLYEIGPRILPPDEAAQAKAAAPAVDAQVGAVMETVLDEIELGEEWARMTRPQRLAWLAFKATLACSGSDTEAFIRGRESGERLAKLSGVAPAETWTAKDIERADAKAAEWAEHFAAPAHGTSFETRLMVLMQEIARRVAEATTAARAKPDATESAAKIWYERIDKQPTVHGKIEELSAVIAEARRAERERCARRS